mgnify:CR=1 FL=1|uniref:TspO/MBR family protein n=1 Tax=viral metagenome TaxID=1070528 RepID=A0A6C0J8T8_9ZZZZ
MNWYNSLKKSSLTPPSYVFKIVWPILYTILTIAFIIIWLNKRCFPFCYPLVFFAIQMVFNLIWTTLFFVYNKPVWALIDVYLMIIFTIVSMIMFYKVNKVATYIMIPYLLWICFASYLNLYIVLNQNY